MTNQVNEKYAGFAPASARKIPGGIAVTYPDAPRHVRPQDITDADGVCRILDLSRKSVRDKSRAGEIPVLMDIGGRRVYSVKAMYEVLEDRFERHAADPRIKLPSR